MLVLGIESTCDETAAAIVEDGYKIFSNEIASQIDIHKKYGGVFPELASRIHIKNIIPIIDLSLKNAKIKKEDIDLIAVAKGPGLIGPLLIGVNVAKALSISLKKPFIGVNHIEAHIYAAMMENLNNLKFPALGLIISGGHTILTKILDIGKYEKIGATTDDAIGESFDKVAKILGLEYPGGPIIEKLAKQGDSNRYDFKAGKIKNRPFDFSFSGLKTKVLYTVKGQNSSMHNAIIIKKNDKKDIAASFQRAVFEDIIKKSYIAAKNFNCKAIYIGGGVSNNQKLKDMFYEKKINIPIFFPKKDLSLDNAAMIAGLGYQKFKKRIIGDLLSLHPLSSIPL
ncbi:MAG: protein kinase [Chlamydiae bacterium SM23_39]|nr:MAG: protein kinase [Chlamydiae bacterium SM23_39]